MDDEATNKGEPEPIGPVGAHVTGPGFRPPLPEDEESAIIDEMTRATEIVMARIRAENPEFRDESGPYPD